MKRVLSLLLLQMFFYGCSADSYPSFRTLYNDYLARQDIKKEKYEEALTKYYLLLENDPERAAIHSNIGILLNMIQKPDEALKSLQYALKLAQEKQDEKTLFAIRYNLGVYYGALKRVPEALDHYQAALELVPDSLETKTNIELLIQQQQKDQQQNQKGEQSQNNPSQGDGRDEQQNKDPGKDPSKDQKDSGEQNDKDQQNQDKKNEEKRESSAKYKPRPYQGDQLSEGDVKKILGELLNQEQKIRANFDKKEKGKSKGNEKDW